MIFVDGVLFSTDLSSSTQGSDHILVALIQHPFLVSVSHSFKSMKEKKVSFSSESGSRGSLAQSSRYVYIFQREYATVDPALVDFVGTDEATTCVGLAIRNRKSGMTSVAHMDFPEIVNGGFTQMLSQLVGPNADTELDVHIIGAFEDLSPQHAIGSTKQCARKDGYSFPLCAKIVETLQKRREKFHIQTLFVLGHNTQWDYEGHARPIFNGFLIETATGSLTPGCFDRTSRCPDDIVRRIRVSAAYEDLSWNGKLLETYDTLNDRFVIAPCRWTSRQERIASALQELSDREILFTCSTSPFAEAADFVETERRKWDYLIKHPEWEKSFPGKQQRVFERTADGGWKRCLLPGQEFRDKSAPKCSLQIS